MWPSLADVALVVQAAAGLVIGLTVARAVLELIRTADVMEARRSVAAGAIAGLGLLVPATVLRSLALRSWESIAWFALVFVLRVGLKRYLAWEASQPPARNRTGGQGIKNSYESTNGGGSRPLPDAPRHQ